MNHEEIDRAVSAEIKNEMTGDSYPAVCDECKGSGKKLAFIARDGWTFEICHHCKGNGSYELYLFNK